MDKNNKNNEEIWKDIPNYEGIYKNSNLGRIKSVKSGRIRKTSIIKGYETVILSKNGENKIKQVHRLVLEAFQPIEHIEKFQANHKDENKLNNTLENLEWLTPKENVNYGTGVQRRAENQRYSNSNRREIICIETGEQYISIRDCSRITGIDKASICRVLKGKQITAGGYHWKYLEDLTDN